MLIVVYYRMHGPGCSGAKAGQREWKPLVGRLRTGQRRVL